MLSGESDDSDEEESDKIGSESGSSGTYSIWFGLLLCWLGFTLGVTLYDNESCGVDRKSLALA